jgi:hypothetical protein
VTKSLTSTIEVISDSGTKPEHTKRGLLSALALGINNQKRTPAQSGGEVLSISVLVLLIYTHKFYLIAKKN